MSHFGRPLGDRHAGCDGVDFVQHIHERLEVAGRICVGNAKNLLQFVAATGRNHRQTPQGRAGLAALDADVSEHAENGHRVFEAYAKALGNRAGVLERLAKSFDGVERGVGSLGQHVGGSGRFGGPKAELPQRSRHDAGRQGRVGPSGTGQVEHRPGHGVDLVWLEARPTELAHEAGHLHGRERRRGTQLPSGVVELLKVCSCGTAHRTSQTDGVVKQCELPRRQGDGGRHRSADAHHAAAEARHRRAELADLPLYLVERREELPSVGPDLDEHTALTNPAGTHVVTSCQSGPNSLRISSGVACRAAFFLANG